MISRRQAAVSENEHLQHLQKELVKLIAKHNALVAAVSIDRKALSDGQSAGEHRRESLKDLEVTRKPCLLYSPPE